MHKKITVFLIVIMAIILLAGCTNNNSADDIFKANMPKIVVQKSPKNEGKLLSIPNVVTYDNSNIHLGIVITIYEDGKKSAYSLITGKNLFSPKEDIDITTFTSRGYGYVTVEEQLTNEVTIYDVFGNKVLKEGMYTHYSVNGTLSIETNKKGKVTGRFYNEQVYYGYMDNNDQEQTSRTYFKINLETFERTQYELEVDEEVYVGQENKFDLDKINLPNHYVMELNDTFYIYNKKDNKRVSSFHLRHGEIMMGFDGKLIVVNEQEVTIDDDYTYVNRFNEYIKLSYQTIDVLSGKFSDLNIDYYIDDFEVLKDKKGNMRYALINVADIVNKKISNNGYYLLIDSSGKTLKDYGSLDIRDLVPLTGGLYYDQYSGYILDKDLAPKIYFTQYNTSIIGHKYIIRGREFSQNLGMVNYEGKEIIPHNNKILDKEFYQGKLFAKDKNDDSFLYDTKGVKTILEGDYRQFTLGLLVKVNETSINVIDYEQETLFTVNNVEEYNHESFELELLFGNYKVLVVTKEDNSKAYIVVNVDRN